MHPMPPSDREMQEFNRRLGDRPVNDIEKIRGRITAVMRELVRMDEFLTALESRLCAAAAPATCQPNVEPAASAGASTVHGSGSSAGSSASSGPGSSAVGGSTSSAPERASASSANSGSSDSGTAWDRLVYKYGYEFTVDQFNTWFDAEIAATRRERHRDQPRPDPGPAFKIDWDNSPKINGAGPRTPDAT